jgi:hypothetical protein
LFRIPDVAVDALIIPDMTFVSAGLISSVLKDETMGPVAYFALGSHRSASSEIDLVSTLRCENN